MKALNALTSQIIGAAIDVHKEIGPGLLESVYSKCLAKELKIRGLSVECEKEIPIMYKGEQVGETLKIDLLVDDAVVVELKSVEELHSIHFKQLLTYVRLTGKKIGLLINFNVEKLKDGIHRVAA
jgi:GxxExxY protein